LTHQHSDHNADCGNLIWLAWASGLDTRIDTLHFTGTVIVGKDLLEL
jgi:ribonuclease BN (tRNA processing enzyme)